MILGYHNDDVNYKWILIIYTIASIAACVLYFLETADTKPEFIPDLDGFYIVFAPYIPCLIWTFFTSLSHRQEPGSTSTSTNDEKKDI